MSESAPVHTSIIEASQALKEGNPENRVLFRPGHVDAQLRRYLEEGIDRKTTANIEIDPKAGDEIRDIAQRQKKLLYGQMEAAHKPDEIVEYARPTVDQVVWASEISLQSMSHVLFALTQEVNSNLTQEKNSIYLLGKKRESNSDTKALVENIKKGRVLMAQQSLVYRNLLTKLEPIALAFIDENKTNPQALQTLGERLINLGKIINELAELNLEMAKMLKK